MPASLFSIATSCATLVQGSINTLTNQIVSRVSLPLISSVLFTLVLFGCEESPESSNIADRPVDPIEPPNEPSPTIRPALDGLWLAGDFHVHTDHSSDGSALRQGSDSNLPGNVSVADQIGQGQLNGLDFMPITDHRTYDQHWDPLWESDQMILIAGEEANGRPHSTVHGAVDMIIQGESSDNHPGIRIMQQSYWETFAQDAVWVIAHPDRRIFANDELAEEAHAFGYHLVEMWNRAENVDREIRFAENRWNAGFRFGIVGGSDNHFRELWQAAGPGMPTTWVFAQAYTERNLLNAMQVGRTSVESGPEVGGSGNNTPERIELTADSDGNGSIDAIGGDEVFLAVGTVVEVFITVQNATGTTVDIYANPGKSSPPIHSFQPNAANADFSFTYTVPSGHSWLRAEMRGAAALASVDAENQNPDEQIRGLTSPLFFSTIPLATPQPDAMAVIPPSDTTDDSASLSLGAVGEFTGFADVAVAAGGLVHVVAEQHDEQGMHIRYRRGAAPSINLVPASATARFPRIAAAGDTVVVVWQDARASEMPRRPDIYWRMSTDGGFSWQAEQRLTDGSSRSERPVVAMLDQQPVIAWMDNIGDGAFDIWAQRIGLDATPTNISGVADRQGNSKLVTTGIPSDTRSARHPPSIYPAIAINNLGDIAITWQDDRLDPEPLWTGEVGNPDGTVPDSWEIYTLVRRSTDNQWPAPVSVSQNLALADMRPDIAWDANQQLIVVWDSREQVAAGINPHIRSSASSDFGATWSAVVDVDFVNTSYNLRPVLTTKPDGSVEALWYSNRSEDWRFKIRRARYENGDWLALGNIAAPGNNTWPRADQDQVVFTTDRNLQRMQRDKTQQVYQLNF